MAVTTADVPTGNGLGQNGHANGSHVAEDDLQRKPRGFFADQFEVRNESCRAIGSTINDNHRFGLVRIAATSMLTSMGPVQKFGVRQMGH